MDTLAQDETLAQLLELKSPTQPGDEGLAEPLAEPEVQKEPSERSQPSVEAGARPG